MYELSHFEVIHQMSIWMTSITVKFSISSLASLSDLFGNGVNTENTISSPSFHNSNLLEDLQLKLLLFYILPNE